MRRAGPRNRAFIVAMAISGVFHLSMVSVFSIMLWFPSPELDYFNVEIVRQYAEPAPPPHTPARGQALRVRTPEELFATDGDGPVADAIASEAGWVSLPPIDLPRLEFAQLDRLRTREESLQIRSQFTELFDTRPRDSWEVFSEELRGLGQRLRSGLTRVAPPEPPQRPVRVSTPAPGFGIYVQWMAAPFDRQLLFSPPVQVLWELDPIEVAGPIALAFTVDAQGKVTDIQIPVEDEEGLAVAVGTALLRYRFAPLREGDTHQRGTLLIAPESPGHGDRLGAGLP